ncbi:hypothetical protein F4814DRAFT_447577 [Daldinia grandis]|nr:hypothetical protein F4814DRAFT_447577 [Daldinia grandis]
MESLSYLESQPGPYNAANSNRGANPRHITFSGVRAIAYAIIKKCLGGLFNSVTEDSQSEGPCYVDMKIMSHSRGYPRLAAIVASSRDYLIVRQFRYLHARVLLDLQDKLQGYEEDLERRDRESQREEHLMGSSNNPQPIWKRRLLKDIEETLGRYRIMMDYASCPRFQTNPPETDIKNLATLSKTHAPFTNEKKKYYLCKSDLGSLNPQEDAALVDGLLTKLVFDKPNNLIKEGTDQDSIIFFSETKFKATLEIILVLTLVTVLTQDSLRMAQERPLPGGSGSAKTDSNPSSPKLRPTKYDGDLVISDVVGYVTRPVNAKIVYNVKYGSFHWKIQLPDEDRYRRYELGQVTCCLKQ